MRLTHWDRQGRRFPPLRWAAWVCPTGTGLPMKQRASPTIHAAIDAGINLLDTGDFYGMGHNEMLLGRALEGRRTGCFSP